MINHTDGNNNPEIQCRFGDAIRELGICRLLKESNIRKKKGGSVYEIFQFLLPSLGLQQGLAFTRGCWGSGLKFSC